jgi:FkbM family methyltransferase
MPHDSVLDLGPGIRATEIPAPFDLNRYTLHQGAERLTDDPLTVRTENEPWWYMVSFPATPGSFARPSDAQPFGWLTRISIELLSGSATVAYVGIDGSTLYAEVPLAAGTHDVDLLLDGSLPSADLMVRRGAVPGTTTVRILGFRAYELIDDDPTVLRPPDRARIDPRRWSRFFGNPSGDLVEQVRHLRFRRLDRPRVMSWDDGLELLVVPGQQISQAVYLSGLYEPATTAVLRKLLRKGDTFVDVGANIGLFTMIASRCVGRSGRVLAFEPSRREFTTLRYHIDHNGLENAQALQVALGSYDGTATLHVADAVHAGLNTIEDRFIYQGVGEAYRETVPVMRLDDVVEQHGISRVDMIKIDVEGAEHRVIAGARQTIARHRPTLVLEITGPALAPENAGRTSIESLLSSLGYDYAAIDGDTGAVRRASNLATVAENLVAARPDVLEALQRTS